MALIGTNYLTLLDWAKRKDPTGTSVAPIVETLTLRNDVLQDMPVLEGNLDTGHQITSRTALPSPTARRINQGILPAKSATDQVVEPAALFESESKVDIEHPGIKVGGPSFRRSEDTAFSQGFNNEIANGIFYYNQKAVAERFHGLTPRLDSLSASHPYKNQIISESGPGSTAVSQSSIWLIGWGPDTVFSFFPRGSEGGFHMEDMGRQRVLDRNGNPFWAWVTRFVWRIGLAVVDYRYIVRICNIETGATVFDGTTAGNLSIYMAMMDALAGIYSPDAVNLRWYMNRRTFSLLNKQLMGKSANLLEWVDANGRRVPSVLGIPIRITDALVYNESVVV